MLSTSLNGQWELHDEAIDMGDQYAEHLSYSSDGWIPQPVPGDIHQGLMASGRIKEPLLGLNSFDCAWTEDRSWWFRRQFDTDPDWLGCDAVELELNGLDANALIFLNGELLGKHASAFYPFRKDVKKQLNPSGVNVLLVRLTSGVENVTDADLAVLGVPVSTEAANGRPERGDKRRVYVRKPQYTFGWDWSPRVATTAIAGNVSIHAWHVARIRDVSVQPARKGKNVDLSISASVDLYHYYSTGTGTIKVEVSDADGKQVVGSVTQLLRSGYNPITVSLRLTDPRYWFPNGMGEQHRYTVKVTLSAVSDREPLNEPAVDSCVMQYGLRFVELDLGNANANESQFAFVVNGKRIFAKGANWIPADTLYARVSAERYDKLVSEAASANFNMLRVWGGGLYEPDSFYDACDRYGILLWHDFMFACAPYPDHDAHFVEQVRHEAEYQTRRLRNHACMALWSGSNENNWGFDEWWSDKTSSGAHIYNYLLPMIVHANCPNIPYWNGSPYGGAHPNSEGTGDRHHWHDCMMNPEMAKRITPEEYDKCQSLFVSEYGYIGAPQRSSVEHYLDGTPLDRNSRVWQHHTNTFEKETVEAGISKHYADASTIDWDKYFLYSGLTQGLMYAYSLESFRARTNCHGGLFWMYADCWGEVGWTIIDYYLRRKVAWYFVRRALAPTRLVMREKDRMVDVTLINDTLTALNDDLEYGWISTDGKRQNMVRKRIYCEPLTRKIVASFRSADMDPRLHLHIARLTNTAYAGNAILRIVALRDLNLVKPRLKHKVTREASDTWIVSVSSNVYAHAVHLTLPESAVPDDDYFDLLPGDTRDVRVVFSRKLQRKDVEVASVVLT